MSFLGMGPLEILMILLVAFIVLGPERMVDAGRLLGKAAREARKLTESLSDLTLDVQVADLNEEPENSRGEGPKPGPAETETDAANTRAADGPAMGADGHVAFRPSSSPEAPDVPKGSQQQEKA